ncbi:uncharacterized protein EDB93DRAFT_1253894 [Suillus bovinus]|uniref:uncharacterized protein n=1 Tax=Suillus bovinus TaxID=48563 RepID=UPI001B8725FC|nr:uncharacterized protein EDB93DRAFT_1253894 [Suillus bovinus]KAG2136599.1 hypothetical protein EDB93DRAFT_1253894 [Suillus bovinus]
MVEGYQQFSIMHHALKVNDIVYEILQHVKSKSDLLNMAMTCSTFSSHALDMLWHQQDNLTPLVKCLPRDTWNVCRYRTIVFSREPLLPEWERVKINAARIRTFIATQYTYGSPTLSGPVLRQLFALFPPATLFPKLRTLHFDAVSPDSLDVGSDSLSLLRQFFSPELENLTFIIPRSVRRNELEQLLGGLSTDASGLRQLAVNKLDFPQYIVPELPKTLNGLDIGPIPMDLMRQNIANIQHLLCLQTLTLRIYGSEDMKTQPSGDMPLKLSTLKRLNLFGFYLEDCIFFLDQIAMPRLSVIEISYYEDATPAEITAVIKSISTACNTFAFLKEISVGSDHPYCDAFVSDKVQVVVIPAFNIRCHTFSDTSPCAGWKSGTLDHTDSPPPAACRMLEGVGCIAFSPLTGCGVPKSSRSPLAWRRLLVQRENSQDEAASCSLEDEVGDEEVEGKEELL